MTTMKLRTPRWIASLAALGLVLGSAAKAEAQWGKRVGGEAFGTYVNAGGVTAQSPLAVLADTGGMAVGEVESFDVGNTVTSRWLMSITTGAVDNRVASSQSTSEVENVNLLGGLVTADIVTAVASSYVSGTRAGSNSAGSGFVNLVVNGVPVTTDVAPNTTVSLPGVGYAVLNEQVPSGDGVTSAGITVNMIHVVLQDALTGFKTGEIIVGSASSQVQ